MGDIVILYLMQNILVFGCIFWLLTWGAEYFFTKKTHLAKKQFYECGFRTLTELNVQINLNFSMLCVFLILYDIEFTFLYPFLFNYSAIYFLEIVIVCFFLWLVIFSVYYDWQFNSLSWQY